MHFRVDRHLFGRGLSELESHGAQNDTPLSKDRMTPKKASVNDTAFDARGWSLKARTEAVIPMNAVPSVQVTDAFSDMRSRILPYCIDCILRTHCHHGIGNEQLPSSKMSNIRP